MTLRLIVSSSPRRLLEAAAEVFLGPLAATPASPFPAPPYLLALRQGGLRDELIALAAERGVRGWFDAPLCTFHELPRWLGATGRKPAGDFERLVLLESLMRTAGGEIFAKLARAGEFVDAVDRVFGALVREGVTPDEFDRAVAGSAEGAAFEVARDGELAALYRAYLTELDTHGMRDGRDDLVDAAAALAADAQAVTGRLGGRREIRVLGLHDLRGGWRTLLAALSESPALDRVVLYAADDGIASDLGLPVQHLDAETTVGEPSPPPRGDGQRVCLVNAPDPEREVEEVARRVRDLVDAGTPLERIAVVSRKARPRVDLVVDALERIGVPASARRRIGFAEIPAVRALAALFAAAAEGWNRHGLSELAAQPYLRTGLDRRLINYLGYRARVEGLDAWLEALQALRDEGESRERGDEESDERGKPLPPSSWVAVALERFERFAAHARALDRPRPLREWLDWLSDFLDDDPWGVERRIRDVPEARWDVARRDLLGWRALGETVRQWRGALGRWGEDHAPLDARVFHERLRELLSADAVLWTPAHRGVRVLEALAAAYRSFDHVFLVGLEAGEFPSRAPRSPVWDDEDLIRLTRSGLPVEPAAVWQARERTLFDVLAASARGSLTLSYARMDERGRAVAPSAFLDDVRDVPGADVFEIPTGRVLTPGYPTYRSAASAGQATHAAAVEHDRARGEPSPYNGLIVDAGLRARIAERLGPAYVWSPTQLESYAKCPWAWFSQRLLRLEKLEDPDADMDAATRGIVFHDALKRFYDAARARVGRPVFLREPDLAWAEPLLRAQLAAAMAAAGERGWLGAPALRPAKERRLTETLVAFLRWEVQENEDAFNKKKRNAPARLRTAVDEHELAFDGLAFERDGTLILLRGSIDRVEVAIDERVRCDGYVAAVDYKSSKWSTPGMGDRAAWSDDVVLQVPLYAWAVTELRRGARVSRTEYRTLRSPEMAHQLQLVTVNRKTEEMEEDPEEAAKFAAALDAVARHVRRVREGEFPAAPAPSCGCPSFCHAWDICRVKGGPQSKLDW